MVALYQKAVSLAVVYVTLLLHMPGDIDLANSAIPPPFATEPSPSPSLRAGEADLDRLPEGYKQVRQHRLPCQRPHTAALWQLQLSCAGAGVYAGLNGRAWVKAPVPPYLDLYLVSAVCVTWKGTKPILCGCLQ